MKLQKILSSLQKLHPKEIDLSLDRIKKLCEKLGNPQDNLQYISVVGTNGKYSTIQAIRAILKDAPILVLDEATSALDSEVEASIQKALELVMDGKTVLAIAHRLSTLSKMDRIIVMEKGKIVENGTHQELLNMRVLYARYWERQSGGFIETYQAAE